MKKYSNIETPYGNVTCKLELESLTGEPMLKTVNNPFALLWAAAFVQPKFGSFLMLHTRGQATLCFYTDETTPGNVQRPDKGRSYEALEFTFKELPDFSELELTGGLSSVMS